MSAHRTLTVLCIDGPWEGRWVTVDGEWVERNGGRIRVAVPRLENPQPWYGDDTWTYDVVDYAILRGGYATVDLNASEWQFADDVREAVQRTVRDVDEAREPIAQAGWRMAEFAEALQRNAQAAGATFADWQERVIDSLHVDQRPYDAKPEACWRCDAKPSATDIGLCEPCHAGLVHRES